MLKMTQEPEQQTGFDSRMDARTQQQVVQLASRLQQQEEDTLTLEQMEAIGEEVGLKPGFIRQAVAQLHSVKQAKSTTALNKAEFWPTIGVFSFPLLWAFLSYLASPTSRIQELYHILAILPLSALLGVVSPRKRIAFLAAAELAFLSILSSPRQIIADAPSLLFVSALMGAIGVIGNILGRRYLPLPFLNLPQKAPQRLSRSELLDLLFSVQRQLEGQKQHLAFLSVDVVGSKQMKQSAPELAVEYSFTQYRQWIEQIVMSYDGRMQIAAGDGIMCLFPTEAAALRAARELQTGMERFNNTYNRLPIPFRIRCGISAGDVAVEEGIPIGHLQSPVLDRAAVLQKQAEPGGIVVGEELMSIAEQEFGKESLVSQVDGGAILAW